MEQILGRGETVMSPKPVFAGDDQPGAPQISKVSGSGGLGDLDDFDEVADAHFAGLKQMKNPQPRRIGKRAELGVSAVSRGGSSGGSLSCSRRHVECRDIKRSQRADASQAAVTKP